VGKRHPGTTIPDGALAEKALRGAWDIIAAPASTQVVLRFTPSVAARVLETTWHPTQRVETAEDGSLVWRATVAGTIEIRLWILSWGDEVEVLEPHSLRTDVASTHRRAAALHGG
jgi:proteasome accessory factor B